MLTSTRELLVAGCVYKAGETLQQPNIHFINTLYIQLGARPANSVTVLLQSEGFREGWCTNAGLASSLSQKETLGHRLPPGPQALGGFGAVGPKGCAGGS